MKLLHFLTGLLLQAAFVVPLSKGAAAPEAPRVRVAQGELEGVVQPGNLQVFLGIPYARPPVGEFRWREPQPAEAWSGIRKADAFGPHPVQRVIWKDMIFRSARMSEDCLYLNVWTPGTKPAKALPVLVYFHGGGLFCGDGSEPRYDGAAMAREGIVAVTVNYRLGVFGFLAHPALSAESPHHVSGNYGMMDQSAALKWVHDNIAAFGGDPARVTIAGESAGSMSVSVHMVSPLSRGLFAGAIGQSGALLGGRNPQTLAQAEVVGEAFARRLKAETVAELRRLGSDQLLEAAFQPGAPASTPVIDGYYLVEPPRKTFEEGRQMKVPLLAGWTSAEVDHQAVMQGRPPTLANYRDAMEHRFGTRAAEALGHYAATSDAEAEQAATDLSSDQFIAHGTWKWLDLHARTGGRPVYRYLFCQVLPDEAPATPGGAPVPAPRRLGAPHASDIAYSLGNLPLYTLWLWTPADLRASRSTQAYFANFIRTGNPNGAGLPDWPALRPASPEFMRLQAEPRADRAVHEDRYRFLDSVSY